MKLVPLGDRIVLKQLEAEETTKSGIVLPGQNKEKPQQAEVIAVGPGGVIDGKEVKMENIKCPLLVVCAKYDHLVPPSSTEPILDLVGSEDKDFHMFDVGHVGIYISPQSKNTIAPVIGDWIAERS